MVSGKNIFKSLLLAAFALSSCNNETGAYVLAEEDIVVDVPQGGFTAKVDQLFRVTVNSVSDEGVSYSWALDGATVSYVKDFEYMFSAEGDYLLELTASQGERSFVYGFDVDVTSSGHDPGGDVSAYVSQVFDYCPAPGQFVNVLPKYEEGDTYEDIKGKVLENIGLGNRGMVSLGGFGGYVTVGFDHRIENREGLMDFRVLGNAFYPQGVEPYGGSCEPGVIMVSIDANGNNIPDDEWYEIKGSVHGDASSEGWYQIASDAGNDVRTISGYTITYSRPDSEPEDEQDRETYIFWTDNQGSEGYIPKNTINKQPYYPLWVDSQSLTFTGTRLPQNSVDQSGSGTYFVLYKFAYGYADNALNTDDSACIDISWAVDSEGNSVALEGVDFIRIYTGVNQVNGWTGEVSTEVVGIEDLHLLGESICSRMEM